MIASALRSWTFTDTSYCPIPSVSWRKAINGRVTNGNCTENQFSKMPIILILPVTASTMAVSHSKIALHFGGGFFALRLGGFLAMAMS
jgi:hypothetical protein